MKPVALSGDAPRIDAARFLQTSWRRKPELFRRKLAPDELTLFTVAKVYSWCRSPASVRIFVRTEAGAAGSARAVRVEKPDDAPSLIEPYRQAGEALTLLINGADRVSSQLRELRHSFGIERAWRHDDIVATLSTTGSGIGYHAGHEDGFIVQLKGARRWSLWDPSVLPANYVQFLLGAPTSLASPPPRASVEPFMSCELSAGDVLYIPALWAHEGITIEESISLSIGWRGLSPYRLLKSLGLMESADQQEYALSFPQHFFRLIPDPPEERDFLDYLCDNLMTSTVNLPTGGPSREQLRQALSNSIGVA